MSYSLTRDEDLFKKFWIDERDNMPRWFQDGSHAWHVTWEEFKAFCDKCEQIYEINGTALVYVERNKNQGFVHFSLLRGEKVDLAALHSIRNLFFKDYEVLFAWVGKHNRGLQRIMEGLGFKYRGVDMRKGESHGKILLWKCYILHRNEIAID